MVSNLRLSLLFAVLVALTCLVAITTRMPGTLAVFWPANALVLGLLLRHPKVAGFVVWVGIALGYLAADLVTGSSLTTAILLNLANMAGVLAGFYTFRRCRTRGAG